MNDTATESVGIQVADKPEKPSSWIDHHDFRFPENMKKGEILQNVPCRDCLQPFEHHFHTLKHAQKVFAAWQGKKWSLLSFNERQLFKKLATSFIANQEKPS